MTQYLSYVKDTIGNNYVGINTTNPTATLDVAGSCLIHKALPEGDYVLLQVYSSTTGCSSFYATSAGANN